MSDPVCRLCGNPGGLGQYPILRCENPHDRAVEWRWIHVPSCDYVMVAGGVWQGRLDLEGAG